MALGAAPLTVWRRIGSAALAIVGVATVVVLVVVPWRAVRTAQRDLADLDTEIVAGSVRRLAAPGPIGAPPAELFTVRRVPEVLVEPVQRRRADAAVDHVVADYPDPACLSIRIDGREVRHEGTREPLIPASVQKLLTAVAVLDVIGTDERFVTTVLAGAPVVDGVLDGDLHLVGGGDPMLAQQEYADAYRRQPQLLTPIEDLAAAVADAGVSRVLGRLIVHDDRYDDVRVVETWPERYRSQFNAGPIGALSVNDGFAAWEPARAYADDPAIHAGEILADELAEVGVRIDRGVARGDLPAAAVSIASVESPPVAAIVQQMLRESDNNTAEALLKELGHRRDGVGTTLGGAAVVEESLERLGYEVDGVVVTDGSGLDRGNLVTCSLLAEVIERAGPDSVIGSGLAVAAESGTIGHRFTETDVAGRLRAKTGLLNNVNGLAGWIEGDDGTVVTFAQLLNGIPLDSRLGFELQERLALDLADVTIDLRAADVARG